MQKMQLRFRKSLANRPNKLIKKLGANSGTSAYTPPQFSKVAPRKLNASREPKLNITYYS